MAVFRVERTRDYTLSVINRESKDAIRSALNELEAAGYIRRRQATDTSEKFSSNEYIIYERPTEPEPSLEQPSSENQTTGKPMTENPTQLNTKKSITDLPSTDSFPFPSGEEETVAGPLERNEGKQLQIPVSHTPSRTHSDRHSPTAAKYFSPATNLPLFPRLPPSP